ncbi:MAG: hypothetical protein ACXWUG_01960 [Polyangiales bacterium]
MRTSLSALVLLAFSACARSDPKIGPAPDPSVASSPPVPVLSVEQTWRALLAAMRSGDDAAIERYTTTAGRASLEKGVSGEDKHVAFARWGKGWADWEIRWKKHDALRAEAALGPEAKEHGLVFVFVDGAWKLDRWLPGE